MTAQPPVLCIVGRKKAGKTELNVALGAELNRRGRRVIAVKHAHGFQVGDPDHLSQLAHFLAERLLRGKEGRGDEG
jgi:hypothetical protein